MNLKSILGAALLLLAAVPAASAGSGGDTECGYERTSTGRRAYVCRSIYRSPYSTTYQTCAANRISSACQTRTVDKTPPKPILPPSAAKDAATGVVVMRGMPDR